VTTDQEMVPASAEFSPIDFFSVILTRHATKLISHISELQQGKNVEAIHGSRVAIRTISSHLETFSPFLRRKSTADLVAQLDWLNAKLAKIRDIDVMINLVGGVENSQVKQPLMTRLYNERLSQELKLQKVLDKPKLDLALKSLANYALQPPIRRKFLALDAKKCRAKITAVISHTWVLLFSQLDNLPKRPKATALHQVRIAAKKCRYAYEAAAESNLMQSPHIEAWTRQLQKQLGQVQDINTLREWIKQQSDLETSIRTQALIYFTPDLPQRKQLIAGSAQTPR
jgi:CHAD domain-containing protein